MSSSQVAISFLTNIVTVSFESVDVEGDPLPVAELKTNKAFVLLMGENNELVKLTVSREEAKRRGIKKGFFGSLEKMASQLISLVVIELSPF